MEMCAKNGILGVLTLALTLALPSAALAETVVPPENSAATQYTEALPTGGGQKDTGKAGGHGKRSPSAVLGSHKAKKLEAQGRGGREAAAVVAATAPSTDVAPAPTSGDRGTTRSQPSANSGQAKAARPNGDEATAQPPERPAVHRLDTSSGSSGLSEILAQATGSSSSGQLGALLPLLILATLIWALAFAWRQRRPTAP